MLDCHSLEVIARFKLALLSKDIVQEDPDFGKSNRGNKIEFSEGDGDALRSQVVEYEGSPHLVLTNDSISKISRKNKRKWSLEFGSPEERSSSSSDEEENSSEEDEEEHPIKKFRLVELLSPLIHPSEVVYHPAISKTYQLQTLAKLASELIDIIEVEQNNLNYLQKLLSVLNGEDWFYLLEENMGLKAYDHGLNEESGEHLEQNNEKTPSSDARPKAEEEKESESTNKRITRTLAQHDHETLGVIVSDPFFALPETLKVFEENEKKAGEETSDNFRAIQEDLTNYLQVSLQRQQEYIKNLTHIRNGIVKTDRFKLDIYKWGKEMYEKKSG